MLAMCLLSSSAVLVILGSTIYIKYALVLGCEIDAGFPLCFEFQMSNYVDSIIQILSSKESILFPMAFKEPEEVIHTSINRQIKYSSIPNYSSL